MTLKNFMNKMDNALVVDKNGVHGLVKGLSEPQITGDSQVLISFGAGQKVSVPQSLLEDRRDGTYQLPLSFAELEQNSHTSGYQVGEGLVVPVLEEDLDVQIRKIETGRVRITKTVHKREEVVDEPLMEEEVSVNRVDINRIIESPPPIRQDGDTMIIPLLEEVLVVEKRLMLKAELHVTKRQFQTRKPQHVILRSEEASVERLSGQQRQDEAYPNIKRNERSSQT